MYELRRWDIAWDWFKRCSGRCSTQEELTIHKHCILDGQKDYPKLLLPPAKRIRPT